MPILAPPPAPVVAAVNDWSGFTVTWTGANGTVIDLVSPESGTVITPDGVKGLSMPEFDRYTTAAPGLAGAQNRGSRTLERSVFWPIFVYGSNSDEWLERDRAFWSTLRPDVPGVWEVTPAGGRPRRLSCRFVSDNQQAYTLDPAQAGWAVYGISLIADDNPYWMGDPVSRDFGPAADSPFFLSTGGVLHISSGTTTSGASIPNPGDVDAWPVWTVTGGVAGAVLSAGGGSVTVPAVASGHVWTIITRPDLQMAVDQSGADVSGQVTWNPAPIPRGAEVDLTITMTTPDSTATVGCALTPSYFRAW